MAARFWVGGGSSANWNATAPTNWAATSGGANNQTVPGASDDVTFNGVGASANSASTISANITVLSLTFTSGYTQTVTLGSGAVTLTVAGNYSDNTAHSWTVTSSAAAPLTLSATCTIASGGKTFPGAVSFTGASTTKTLSGNWTITGSLSFSAATIVLNWTTNETLSCSGLTMTSAAAAGTAKIILTGGTWQTSGAVINDLDIAGNVTVSGTVGFSTKTLTYLSGTVTTTSSNLAISGSSIINTAGITWNNITISNTITLTINSLLTCTGILTIPQNNTTFAGSSGFSASTLTCSSVTAITITLVNGITYTVTTALNCFLSRNGAIVLWTSDHASIKAILTLNQGATCNVLASFTRIDSNGGRQINTFNGTVTTCFNIHAFTDVEGIFFSNPKIIGASTY